MTKKLLLFCSLFLIAQLASAQVGITSVPFLQIEPDSRAAGMGNTGVALADNASAVFWNPAGLGFQRGNQVSITHSEWLPQFNADLFYDYLVGKHYVEDIGTFGGHISYLNLGEQIKTDETGPDEINRFNSYELAVGISYGLQLNKNWSLGSGVRFIYSSLAEGQVGTQDINPGSTVGVDIAGMYKSDPFTFIGQNASLQAGLNISNIGPGVKYTNNAQEDPLPTVFRLGWAFTTELDQNGVNTLTIANDISKILARVDDTGDPTGALEALFTSWGSLQRETNNGIVTLNAIQQLMVGTGVEYWYNNLFALRSGFYFEDPNNGDRKFLTFGAGIRYDIVGVDFSYIYTLEENHPLANTTRFGLLINF